VLSDTKGIHGAYSQGMNPFYEQVYAIVERIPCGKVVSYGQIAWMLDRPRSAREVGRAMRCCPEHLPWQRVVMADGTIARGVDTALCKAMLKAEGVTFLPGGRVDMELCRMRNLPLDGGK